MIKMDSIRVEGIDVEIQIVFRAEYIQSIVPHLRRIGVTDSTLDDLIENYIKSGELVSYERWFLEYGQKNLNPLMNKLLNRPSGHPTFNNLLKFSLKDQMENDPILVQLRKAKEF
jgi:hypothetical protein